MFLPVFIANILNDSKKMKFQSLCKCPHIIEFVGHLKFLAIKNNALRYCLHNFFYKPGPFSRFIYFSFYIWKAERQRSSICWSHPKCPQQPELGQTEARNIKLNWGLPHKWQGSKYLNHHLLHPTVSISKKLDWKHGSWDLIQMFREDI